MSGGCELGNTLWVLISGEVIGLEADVLGHLRVVE